MAQSSNVTSPPPVVEKSTYTHHLSSIGLVNSTAEIEPLLDDTEEFRPNRGIHQALPLSLPTIASTQPAARDHRILPSTLPTSAFMRDNFFFRRPLLTAPAPTPLSRNLGTPARAANHVKGTIDRSMHAGFPDIWEDWNTMTTYEKEVCETREIKGAGKRLAVLREVWWREKDRLEAEARVEAEAILKAMALAQGEGGEMQEEGEKEEGMPRVDSMEVLEELRKLDGASFGEEA